VGFGNNADGASGSAMPSFVPSEYAAPISKAAQRWNVSAALISAQLYAESNFNPFAQSPAGRAGDCPVHAGHRGRDGARQPVRRG
jgi:soluble lytic murein transglycosylase-like protein